MNTGMCAAARGRARLIAAGLALACGPIAWSEPARAQDILQYKGPDRESRIIEGARKEGQVIIYSAAIVNQALRPMADAFMRKYPFVRMTYWRGDTDEIVAKLSAETRARNVVPDVVEGTGIAELTVEAGMTLPYYTPLAAEVPERYRDPSGHSTSTRISYFSVAYNTRLVAPADVPRTYDDLLDPRWKGKLAWRVATVSGTPLFLTSIRLARGEDGAKAYFKRLVEQKVINFASGSARTLVDRVIAGEFPIALNIFAHHPKISKAKGAPVDSQLMDPVPSTAGTMIIPKGVRRPHAALLLADFILSKEGQQIFAGADYFPVRPDVPPRDSLAGVIPEKAGMKELFVSSDKLTKFTEQSSRIYEEMFR